MCVSVDGTAVQKFSRRIDLLDVRMLLQCTSEAAVSSDVGVNKTVDDVLSRLSQMIADKLVHNAACHAFIAVIIHSTFSWFSFTVPPKLLDPGLILTETQLISNQ